MSAVGLENAFGCSKSPPIGAIVWEVRSWRPVCGSHWFLLHISYATSIDSFHGSKYKCCNINSLSRKEKNPGWRHSKNMVEHWIVLSFRGFRYHERENQTKAMRSLMRTASSCSKCDCLSGVVLPPLAQRSAALIRLDISDVSVPSSPFPYKTARITWRFLNETFWQQCFHWAH